MSVATLGAILLMEATAYGLGCDAPGPLTKAGTIPVAGHTIAADPRVLPLGSIVHVEGVGRRQVHDVGGAVKGHIIDLFMDDCADAREWGRRRVRVYVLHVPQGMPAGQREAPEPPGFGPASRLPRSARAGEARAPAADRSTSLKLAPDRGAKVQAGWQWSESGTAALSGPSDKKTTPLSKRAPVTTEGDNPLAPAPKTDTRTKVLALVILLGASLVIIAAWVLVAVARGRL